MSDPAPSNLETSSAGDEDMETSTTTLTDNNDLEASATTFTSNDDMEASATTLTGNDDMDPDMQAKVLLQHCKLGQIDEVRTILRNKTTSPHGVFDKTSTPLRSACGAGHLGIVKLLVEAGAKVNEVNKKGSTVLHYAVQNNATQVVAFLIEAEADVNAKSMALNGVRIVPLHVAARRTGSRDVCEKLLSADADVNYQGGRMQFSALHLVAAHGDTGVAKLLLSHGANANAEGATNVSPLHVAALNNHPAMVKLLFFNGGAKINGVRFAAVNPLHVAVKHGLVNMVQLLVSLGGDLTAVTPLSAPWSNIDCFQLATRTREDANTPSELEIWLHTVTRSSSFWVALHTQPRNVIMQLIKIKNIRMYSSEVERMYTTINSDIDDDDTVNNSDNTNNNNESTTNTHDNSVTATTTINTSTNTNTNTTTTPTTTITLRSGSNTSTATINNNNNNHHTTTTNNNNTTTNNNNNDDNSTQRGKAFFVGNQQFILDLMRPWSPSRHWLLGPLHRNFVETIMLTQQRLSTREKTQLPTMTPLLWINIISNCFDRNRFADPTENMGAT